MFFFIEVSSFQGALRSNSVIFLLPRQMMVQLGMEESTDDRQHSLHHSQLEREVGEGLEKERERLTAAQASLAATQVRQNCRETVREVERRRREAEEDRRQELTQGSERDE